MVLLVKIHQHGVFFIGLQLGGVQGIFGIGKGLDILGDFGGILVFIQRIGVRVSVESPTIVGYSSGQRGETVGY